MVPIYKFLIAVVVINSLVNFLVLNLLIDSRLVPLVTALWMAIGYVRIFGRHMYANSFREAFKGVFMALAWPIVPATR